MARSGKKQKERNLKSESEWRKQKYKRFVVDIDREYGEKFAKLLQKEKIKYSDWVKERIEDFMKKK